MSVVSALSTGMSLTSLLNTAMKVARFYGIFTVCSHILHILHNEFNYTILLNTAMEFDFFEGIWNMLIQ